jgi:hypothetical protein
VERGRPRAQQLHLPRVGASRGPGTLSPALSWPPTWFPRRLPLGQKPHLSSSPGRRPHLGKVRARPPPPAARPAHRSACSARCAPAGRRCVRPVCPSPALPRGPRGAGSRGRAPSRPARAPDLRGAPRARWPHSLAPRAPLGLRPRIGQGP